MGSGIRKAHFLIENILTSLMLQLESAWDNLKQHQACQQVFNRIMSFPDGET